MSEKSPLDELKAAGNGRPATEEIASLYQEAFRTFGTQALWSRKPIANPTIAQALVVSEGLRREGDMNARRLAIKIEQACRAAL